MKVYVCENPACSLGVPGLPGRFTGGASPEMALRLTGNPEAPSGEGVCPNCGKPGSDAGEEHDG